MKNYFSAKHKMFLSGKKYQELKYMCTMHADIKLEKNIHYEMKKKNQVLYHFYINSVTSTYRIYNIQYTIRCTYDIPTIPLTTFHVYHIFSLLKNAVLRLEWKINSEQVRSFYSNTGVFKKGRPISDCSIRRKGDSKEAFISAKSQINDAMVLLFWNQTPL